MEEEASTDLVKAPRPDERRKTTDIAFRQIVQAETSERQVRTERLRAARMEASVRSLD